MLTAKGIEKYYGNLWVLKGVNVHIQKGEIVSIVGPSGCGKSTLLHIVGTLDVPAKGEVILQNERISELKGRQLADFRNQHIGFVFQFHHLLPEFSALENVCIPGWIAGTKKSEVEERATELLNVLGVGHRIDNKPGALSGGEQQRVDIARAMLNSPKLILADEPTGNLDPETSDGIMQLLFRICREGTAIVMATHDYIVLQKFPSRVLRTENGHVTDNAAVNFSS